MWAILLAMAAFAQNDAKDWPMYNRDVMGSRYNPAEIAINQSNAGKLVEKWRFPAKGSDLEIGVIHATPIVVQGDVYFGTTTVEPTFYKLGPHGKVRWSYRNPVLPQTELPKDEATRKTRFASNAGGIFTSALVTEDTVYFGDLEGWYYAPDRATGKERWKLKRAAKEFPDAHPMNLFFASPILADGKLIVAGGTLEQVVASFPGYKGCTGRGFVMALEPSSGKVVWKYDVGPKPQPLDPPITIKDSWGDHVFYFGPATSSVWSTPSFDAESGTIFFGTDVNTAPRRPTEDNRRLHTRESCAVIALNVHDGIEKWVTQINPGDVWTNAMRGYDPKEGRYKDQSIGDTPKIYSIPVEGKPTKVVGVGWNGGLVLNPVDGRIVTNAPIYTGPPTYPLTPQPDRRMLALPGLISGFQNSCVPTGKAIFTNDMGPYLRLGATGENSRRAACPDGRAHHCDQYGYNDEGAGAANVPRSPSLGGPLPDHVTPTLATQSPRRRSGQRRRVLRGLSQVADSSPWMPPHSNFA